MGEHLLSNNYSVAMVLLMLLLAEQLDQTIDNEMSLFDNESIEYLSVLIASFLAVGFHFYSVMPDGFSLQKKLTYLLCTHKRHRNIYI